MIYQLNRPPKRLLIWSVIFNLVNQNCTSKIQKKIPSLNRFLNIVKLENVPVYGFPVRSDPAHPG